jgi:5-methylthioadenosine/S-adenosylhomocysteine deaminase
MRDDIGMLSAGRLADLIAIDLSGVHTTPVHRLPATIVYSARGADVTLTMVGGRVVFDGERVAGVDEPQLLDELRARAFSIAARLSRTLPKPDKTRVPHRHVSVAGQRP